MRIALLLVNPRRVDCACYRPRMQIFAYPLTEGLFTPLVVVLPNGVTPFIGLEILVSLTNGERKLVKLLRASVSPFPPRDLLWCGCDSPSSPPPPPPS